MNATLPALKRGLAAFAFCLASVGAVEAQQAPPDKDALAALNDSFRSTYRETRTWRLARVDAVIVVQFDDLHLIRGGQTRTERFTPPVYHDYKAIAHIPLALYVKLAPAVGKPFDKAMLDWMTMYLKQIQAAAATLERRPGWTPEQLRAHKAIADASLRFMERVMGAEEVKDAELTAYTRAMRPLVLASADAAAKAQLDGLHALVTRWRAELGPAWGQVHVVVLGPKQPRPGNVQYEYFVRAMGRAAVGKRLWYAEGVFDKDGGVNLLGTILLDRGASIAFFADPARLERDLLADGAQRHLNRLFPARR
jgi:catechol 2,3-dioxygenase-like lactoylglutathione lyase family enzyme